MKVKSSSEKVAKATSKPAVKKNPPVVAEVQNKASVAVGVDEHTQRIINVRKVVRERDRCRLETEDFAKSDILRERLKDLGVDVIDQKNGPSGWKFIDGSSNKLKAGTAVPEDAMRKRKMEEVEAVQSKPAKSKKSDDKPEVQSSSTNSSPLYTCNLHISNHTISIVIISSFFQYQRKLSKSVIKPFSQESLAKAKYPV